VTPRQLDVLRYVETYQSRNGCAPTLQEIANQLRLSKITVLAHLRNLEKARRIKRSRYGRRAIEVLQPTRRVPVVGRIAAGRPIEAVETREEVTLNEFVASGRDYFALQVRGDSMIDDHILDGDHVIVERRSDARDGEVVVALLESGEATLKRIYREAGRIRLQPANAAMAPMVVDRVDVQGVVVGVYRLL
jgi:repressor LexA